MINEYNYLYNTETGTNDEEVDRYSQKQVDLTLRKNKRYPCSKRYGGYKNRA